MLGSLLERQDETGKKVEIKGLLDPALHAIVANLQVLHYYLKASCASSLRAHARLIHAIVANLQVTPLNLLQYQALSYSSMRP